MRAGLHLRVFSKRACPSSGRKSRAHIGGPRATGSEGPPQAAESHRRRRARSRWHCSRSSLSPPGPLRAKMRAPRSSWFAKKAAQAKRPAAGNTAFPRGRGESDGSICGTVLPKGSAVRERRERSPMRPAQRRDRSRECALLLNACEGGIFQTRKSSTDAAFWPRL